MSLNAALEQKYMAEIDAISVMLRDFFADWRRASTQEQRQLIEADAISLFERILDFEEKVSDIFKGDYPELISMLEDYDEVRYRTLVVQNKLRRLIQLFIKYFNSEQIALSQCIGKLKRIRQKRAALSIWKNKNAKFVLAEHFYNLDRLGSSFISNALCEVDVSQGVLTLPVQERSLLRIKELRVTENSNGNPGNSDISVTSNNNSVDFINGEPGKWFEYERLDAGPLELELSVDLAQEEILNHISIEPVNFGQNYSYLVDDIVFITSGRENVSIKSLVSQNLDVENWVVKPVGNDNFWDITFLPVKAKKILFKFKQPAYHVVQVSRENREKVARKRWAIGIKTLNTFRYTYENEGGINSVIQSVPEGVYAGVPFIDIWPANSNLYDLVFECSLDGGTTWIESTEIDDGVGSTLLFDGMKTNALWRLSMSRNVDAMENISSFGQTANVVPEVSSLTRVVTGGQNPVSFTLNTKPADAKTYVIQPRVARRGNYSKQLTLTRGTGSEQNIRLPFNPLDYGLEPSDIKLFKNRQLLSYNRDNNAVGAGEWSFNDTFDEIQIEGSASVNDVISFVINEEQGFFEETADGFFHKMELPFDPDKKLIDVRYVLRSPIRTLNVLEKDKQIINLRSKNIVPSSFKLVSSEGVSYTQVERRSELEPNTYLVDFENGILHLGSAFGDDSVSIIYEYYDKRQASFSDFEIYYSNGMPAGIVVSPEKIEAVDVTETISESPFVVYDIANETYQAREDVFSTSNNKRTLSYKKIVKGSFRVSEDLLGSDYKPEEVDFIDGSSEFLGLIPMKNEKTTSITADLSGIVSFKLNAGSLYYSTLGISFSDTVVFAVKESTLANVDSIGDYHIASDGTVSVYVGAGNTLDSGIQINYFYKSPSFDPINKYSVDYKNGVLYSHSGQSDSATVKYKVASYAISYDVAKPMLFSEYSSESNSVSVDTQFMSNINNLLKINWVTKKKQDSLRDLSGNFSPIVSLVGIRFK